LDGLPSKQQGGQAGPSGRADRCSPARALAHVSAAVTRGFFFCCLRPGWLPSRLGHRSRPYPRCPWPAAVSSDSRDGRETLRGWMVTSLVLWMMVVEGTGLLISSARAGWEHESVRRGAWAPRSQGVALSRDWPGWQQQQPRAGLSHSTSWCYGALSVWIDSGCGLCRYCHDVPPPSSVKLADLRMVRA